MLRVSKNIQTLLTEFDVSNAELARNIGVDKSTITRWFKSDSSPRGESVQAIADYFNIPSSFLYDSEQRFNDELKLMSKPKPTPIHEVSAGTGRTSPAPEQMPNKDGEIAKVVGDSMLPTLHNGDMVRVVEVASIRDLEPKDIALVRINGDECTLKHCELTADGLWVRGENKDVFTDRLYTMSECLTLPVQIVGKAVEIVSRML